MATKVKGNTLKLQKKYEMISKAIKTSSNRRLHGPATIVARTVVRKMLLYIVTAIPSLPGTRTENRTTTAKFLKTYTDLWEFQALFAKPV